MTDKVSSSALFELGKRLERLLYFGTLLLLLCFLELYFVSTTISARTENPEGVSELISKIETNSVHLNQLFELAQQAQATTKNQTNEAKYLAMRRRLGLPDVSNPVKPQKETYKGVMSDLVATVSKRFGVTIEKAKRLIDTQKSPDQILIALHRHHQELMKTPTKVWGIETPLVVPVQYGTAQYQVPASFIANGLLVGLIPLLIAWFGSLYVTRQRELLILRQMSDYKVSFPHVLNILPVVFTSYFLFGENRFNRKNAKTYTLNRAINRIVTSTIRSFILLLFIIPMGLIAGYSMGQLVLIDQDITAIELTITSVAGLWLLIQAISLIAQEWIILWGKEYYS